MEIEVIPRKWGSSIGIVIPQEVVETENIQENKKIKIEIKKERAKAGELWGILKDWKKPTQQIKDEMKKGWD
ncbi:AbrB/MazE/SpoVT family DNA-binding domain-containing protein [Candidatus Pacearchaeota archaeon]|nr:AbrB/MazE/SpoVT family DNA-binding domain-containing protein [Candidatus Pacearchaeota archaeon]